MSDQGTPTSRPRQVRFDPNMIQNLNFALTGEVGGESPSMSDLARMVAAPFPPQPFKFETDTQALEELHDSQAPQQEHDSQPPDEEHVQEAPAEERQPRPRRKKLTSAVW